MGEIWGRNGRETAVAEWRWTQHPALASGPAELLLTFMSNGDAPIVAADTRLYVPQAVRLTIATTP